MTQLRLIGQENDNTRNVIITPFATNGISEPSAGTTGYKFFRNFGMDQPVTTVLDIRLLQDELVSEHNKIQSNSTSGEINNYLMQINDDFIKFGGLMKDVKKLQTIPSIRSIKALSPQEAYKRRLDAHNKLKERVTQNKRSRSKALIDLIDTYDL